MYATRLDPRTLSTPTGSASRDNIQPRAAHRERDFGVGYGSSSGYAAANDRRYAQSWAKTYFRCS